MATLTIKNLPDELYQELKRRAGENRRSLNREVVYSLEQLIKGERARARPSVADFRALREKYPLSPLSEEELARAIDEGTAVIIAKSRCRTLPPADRPIAERPTAWAACGRP